MREVEIPPDLRLQARRIGLQIFATGYEAGFADGVCWQETRAAV
jgi:hypothetical protein